MLIWIAFKIFLKKIWVFLKTYWYVPFFLIIALVSWIWIGKGAKNNTFKVLEEARKNYKKQIEIINKIHEDEITKRDEIINKYKNTMIKIENEYAKKSMLLGEDEKKEIKKLAKKYVNDPETYTKKIAERFGFEYVEDK